MSKIYLPGVKYKPVTSVFEKLTAQELSQNSLAVVEKISVNNSIPNIWNAALHYKWSIYELETSSKILALSKDLLETYLKGLFVGVFEIKVIPLEKKSILTDIIDLHNPLSKFQEKIDEIYALTYKQQIIAINYPETIFFPAAQFSSWPQTPEIGTMEEEMILYVENTFNRLGSSVRDSFILWIQEILSKNIVNGLREVILDIFGLESINFTEENLSHLESITNKHNINFQIMSKEGLKQVSLRYFNPLQDGNDKLDKWNKDNEGNILNKDGKIIISIKELNEIGIVFSNGKFYAWLPKDKEKRFVKDVISVVYLKNSIRFEYQGMFKDFDAEILTEEKVFVKEIILLNRKDSDNWVIPNYPIRDIKYQNIVVLNQTEILSVEYSEDGKLNQIKYSVQCKAIGTKEITVNYRLIPSEIINASIEFWPTFKDDNWNIYYYFFHVDIDNREIKDFNSTTYNEKFEEIVNYNLVNKSQVKFAQKHSSYFNYTINKESMGLINLDNIIEFNSSQKALSKNPSSIFQTVGKNNKNITFSIDFGTSSTCIGYSVEEGDPQIFDVEFSRTDLFSNFKYNNSFIEKFLPSGKHRNIPSQILEYSSFVNEEIETKAHYSYSLSYLLFDSNDDFRVSAKTISDLKWNSRKKYQKAFLYLILKEIFAYSKLQGCKEINFKLSFPLSFENDHLLKYIQTFKEIADKFKNFISVKTISLTNESAAGAFYAMNAGKSVVIDMGGGSTDIAFMDKGEIVFSESIKFAGNNILSKIAKEIKFDEEIEKRRNEGDIDFWDYIIYKIRNSKIDDIIDDSDTKNITNAKRLVTNGRSIIFEYLRRVFQFLSIKHGIRQARVKLESDQKKIDLENITIFLLGRGWNINLGANIEEFLGSLFLNYDIKEPLLTDGVLDTKEGLVINLLRMADSMFETIELDKKDDHQKKANKLLENKKSFAGADFQIKFKDKDIEKYTWEQELPFPIPGETKDQNTQLNFSFTELYLDLVEVNPLHEYFDSKIIDIANVKCANKLYSRLNEAGNELILKKSPFVIFIENVFKELYEAND